MKIRGFVAAVLALVMLLGGSASAALDWTVMPGTERNVPAVPARKTWTLAPSAEEGVLRYSARGSLTYETEDLPEMAMSYRSAGRIDFSVSFETVKGLLPPISDAHTVSLRADVYEMRAPSEDALDLVGGLEFDLAFDMLSAEGELRLLTYGDDGALTDEMGYAAQLDLSLDLSTVTVDIADIETGESLLSFQLVPTDSTPILAFFMYFEAEYNPYPLMTNLLYPFAPVGMKISSFLDGESDHLSLSFRELMIPLVQMANDPIFREYLDRLEVGDALSADMLPTSMLSHLNGTIEATRSGDRYDIVLEPDARGDAIFERYLLTIDGEDLRLQKQRPTYGGGLMSEFDAQLSTRGGLHLSLENYFLQEYAYLDIVPVRWDDAKQVLQFRFVSLEPSASVPMFLTAKLENAVDVDAGTARTDGTLYCTDDYAKTTVTLEIEHSFGDWAK